MPKKTTKTSKRPQGAKKAKITKKSLITAKPVKAKPMSKAKKHRAVVKAKKVPSPLVRFIRKPYVIAPALALAVGGIFLGVRNYVPSLESVQESVVLIEACNNLNYDCGTGSGFAAFKDNYIVTNYHVISGADEIKIKTTNGVEGSATSILAIDPVKDIAIIEWNRTLDPIRLGSSDQANVGDKVLAIGNPLDETNVVSEGIISNKNSEHGLMTTAAISPGSSGGALILDSNHRVIGVTYLKKTSGESMNYAVKIEDVIDVFNNYNQQNYYAINANSSDSCQTTLAKISLDVGALDFSGCSGANNNIYSVSSLDVFSKVTNRRRRFEYALTERADWKVMYDRLTSSVKNLLVYTLNDSKSSAFNTNWKYAIWYANENYYYTCKTDSCKVHRYVYGTYPTEYTPTSEIELQEL